MKYILAFCCFFVCLDIAQADDRFTFGSYGRIGIHTNDELAQPNPTQVTHFGPRLLLGNYLELDFGWRALKRKKQGNVRVVTTMSLGNRFAHYDGDFASGVGVRQAFVEATELFGSSGYVWVGSRMARGDDIYLLNFWPLDDLNIVGGGMGFKKNRFSSEVVFGLNRVFEGYQVQQVAIPAIDFGQTEIDALNRQRAISALKLGQEYGGNGSRLGLKWKLYGEFHYLADGELTLDSTFSEKEPLPDDSGWLIGAQLGLWNFGKNSHFNLWVRYANGLAAFDELQRPVGVNSDRRVSGTDEFRVAMSGNIEFKHVAVMAGGYYRFFKDADPNEVDFDDGNEFVGVTRILYLNGIFTPGIEASTQLRRANGINPRTRDQRTAQITQIAVIPALSFGQDPGSFTRPQIRMVGAVSFLNQGARDQFPAEDLELMKRQRSLSVYRPNGGSVEEVVTNAKIHPNPSHFGRHNRLHNRRFKDGPQVGHG